MGTLRRYFSCLAFALGLFLLFLYWFHLKTPMGRMGYSEDLGGIEISRVIMADNLAKYGHPEFHTDRMMAPYGITAPYYSWALERDWIGAYMWRWSPDFPWLWAYFGISLLICYLAGGCFFGKMRLGRAAWPLAFAIVFVNVPRHYKVYYHYEHLIQHWLYLSMLLDAWIWRRYWREKRWSLNLELWRGFIMLGTFGTTGYYWGPMILEWAILRLCLFFSMRKRKRAGQPTAIEWRWQRAIAPVALGLALFAIDLRWFLPLARAASALGKLWQPVFFFANFPLVFRPLWLEWLVHFFPSLYWPLMRMDMLPIDGPDTVVTAGWIYWIPLVFAIALARRKRGGPGEGLLLPFLILLFIEVFYLRRGFPVFFQGIFRTIVPFMEFFRTASRMGLFIPITIGVMLALAWPELTAAFARAWRAVDRRKAWGFRAAFGIFIATEALGMTHLFIPVKISRPLKPAMEKMLADIKGLPGTTVLDMPFCVAGGNGICTTEQCPNYPLSTVPGNLTLWHDKKVYGCYQARLTFSECDIYQRGPFPEWFQAWRLQRCLTPDEWKDFCDYLGEHTETSAVLVYPGIWRAVQDPQCRAEFDRHLGAPKGQALIYLGIERGGLPRDPSEVLWYQPRCVLERH